MNLHVPTPPDLQTLIGLFYDSPDELGQFTETAGADMPQPYRSLLKHQEHMTVTVEAFHHSPVDVQVLSVQKDNETYCRRILLQRQSDQKVVQFGIVRLNVGYLQDAVRREIESESIPLGRALIQHDVLRLVELCQLYRIRCGPDLARLFGVKPETVTYGRTALIHCDGEPAVELLEIVTPC